MSITQGSDGDLTVTRQRHWLSGMRKFDILLDGVKTGTIGNGETVTLRVPAGGHDLQLKLDIVRSNPVRLEVQGRGTCRVTCRCTVTGFKQIFYAWYLLGALFGKRLLALAVEPP